MKPEVLERVYAWMEWPGARGVWMSLSEDGERSFVADDARDVMCPIVRVRLPPPTCSPD